MNPDQVRRPILASYVLPLKAAGPAGEELTAHLQWLSSRIAHVRPAPEHACANGKVANVLTGLDLATHERVVIADDDVMFENLKLIRTIEAAGGRTVTPLDLYVRRLPPTTRHFSSQRVRQAYDELARPARMAVELAVLPVVVAGGIMARAATPLRELHRRLGSGARDTYTDAAPGPA